MRKHHTPVYHQFKFKKKSSHLALITQKGQQQKMMFKKRKLKVYYNCCSTTHTQPKYHLMLYMKLHISEQQFSANSSSNPFDKKTVADKNKTHYIFTENIT